jgi:predicted transcriptional regulator
VEGRDELAVLPKLGELRFRNDPVRLRNFRRWSIVQLEGARQEPIAKLLGRLLRNDAIRAQAKEGAFALLVALDRDYERQPGWSDPTTEGGVVLTQHVWSRHSLESLFTVGPVLTRWVRALLGKAAPEDLEGIVQRAIEAADGDPGLIADAVGRYTASIVLAASRDGAAPLAKNAAIVREASEQAQRSVLAEPAVWQHGKTRAQFILNQVRNGLAPAARGHFPTDVVRLIERVDTSQIGVAEEAIPPEALALLDRMAKP